jgi:hypothetical protein
MSFVFILPRYEYSVDTEHSVHSRIKTSSAKWMSQRAPGRIRIELRSSSKRVWRLTDYRIRLIPGSASRMGFGSELPVFFLDEIACSTPIGAASSRPLGMEEAMH